MAGKAFMAGQNVLRCAHERDEYSTYFTSRPYDDMMAGRPR